MAWTPVPRPSPRTWLRPGWTRFRRPPRFGGSCPAAGLWPAAAETATVVVAAVLRRPTQPTLAGRHHPLAARRWQRRQISTFSTTTPGSASPRWPGRSSPAPRCGRSFSRIRPLEPTGGGADRQRCGLHREQRGDGRVALEVQLGLRGVGVSHSRPYHPQTCGKGGTADQQAIEADIVDLVTLLIASGLRLGEALSLRWADVDLESGTLEVKGTVLRVKGEGLLITSSPKSAAGHRILELPTWAADMLRRRYASRVGDLVFPAPRSGTVRDRSNTGRSLRSAFARAGFAGLSSHAFRKSVATLMSEAGLSSRDAADQLGHSRPSMTTDVYFGRKKRARGAAAVLENLFDG